MFNVIRLCFVEFSLGNAAFRGALLLLLYYSTAAVGTPLFVLQPVPPEF